MSVKASASLYIIALSFQGVKQKTAGSHETGKIAMIINAILRKRRICVEIAAIQSKRRPRFNAGTPFHMNVSVRIISSKTKKSLFLIDSTIDLSDVKKRKLHSAPFM